MADESDQSFLKKRLPQRNRFSIEDLSAHFIFILAVYLSNLTEYVCSPPRPPYADVLYIC